MPKVILTDLTIKNLKPLSIQTDYFDASLPAFGVRVSERSKVFFVMRGNPRKRITLGKYPQKTLKQARHEANSTTAPITSLESPNLTAGDHVRAYLNAIQVRPRTFGEYKRLLITHFIPALGTKALSEITAHDILAITDKLQNTPVERLHAHVAMSVFFNWCVRRMLIPVSPMAPLKQPSKVGQRNRLLTDAEVVHIWRASFKVGEPFGAIVRVCLLSGQRRGEISQLRSDWLGPDTLTIPASVAKNGVAHTIPSSASLRQYVISITSAASPFRGWSKSKKRLDSFLPPQMPPFVLHDLRRYFSSTLARLGVPIDVTEALLNHVSGSRSPLQRIYDRHDRLPEMRAAMEKYHAHLSTILSASMTTA